MIKFWTHRYELIPWGAIGAVSDAKPRKGALLKCQWPNGRVGYSDIFPWPEFGDAPIDEQIKEMAYGRLTTLVEQSIWLAKKDATLRSQAKNAFVGGAKIKNHYLINDFTKFNDENMKELRTLGFTTLKVKVGRAIDDEAKFVLRMIKQNPVLVRLDFNAKLGFSEFERFASHFSAAEKSKIEFVEDPIPWDVDAWTEAAKLMPLAMDLEYDKILWDKFTDRPPFSVVVIKPARQDVEKALHWVNRFALKMTISNSLDHSVGMAHSLAVAIELKKFYPNTLLDCGCISLRAYQPNDFSARIQMAGPFLKEIVGTGIGFNDLLEKIEWTAVQK